MSNGPVVGGGSPVANATNLLIATPLSCMGLASSATAVEVLKSANNAANTAGAGIMSAGNLIWDGANWQKFTQAGLGAALVGVQAVGKTTSGLVTLFSGTTPSAPGTSAQTPVTGLGGYSAGMILAQLVGATGGTLDVYSQTSPDGGVTWSDYIHMTQLAAGAAAIIKGYAVGAGCGPIGAAAGATVGINLAPALTSGAAAGGDFGDRMRILLVAGAGTTVGAAIVLTALFKT